MKRISIVGLGLVVALAISGGATSAASAACFKVLEPATGLHLRPNCADEAKAGGLYIEVESLGTEIAPRVWCAPVAAGTGNYEDSACTKKGEKKNFIKITLPSWWVNGTRLAAGATVALANTAQVDESTVLNAPSLGIKLTCTGGTSKVLSGKGAFIQGSGFGGAESLTFAGCSEITPSTCTIQTEISTNAVVATVEPGPAMANRILFTPRTGKTFATIEFNGTCAESGEQPVNGKVVFGSSSGQEELAMQPLEGLGTTENTSLELFSRPAYLEKGKALLLLASGKTWSFH